MHEETAIAFSGGRTSAFMLWHILDAHDGQLPEYVKVAFMNTGLEHEKTLEFVREVQQRWNVDMVWLEGPTEYPEGKKTPDTFRIVDFCSASRNGEPLEALIAARNHLPTVVMRWCTGELKIKLVRRYLEQTFGWDEYQITLGLRADEPWRVAKINQYYRKGVEQIAPMHAAGHDENDVLNFWKNQDFDLDLPGGDNTFGNCVGCFLKSVPKLKKICDAKPEHFDWWSRMEEKYGMQFRPDRPSYKNLQVEFRVQGRLFDDSLVDDSIPCTCTD
tara:strand:- start:2122 stop:2943 length:822 start_codon:yes stop_codon:yes gene_type:complete